MKDEEIIQSAEKFLATRFVRFVKPGSITRRNSVVAEVVFLIPEALDPTLVVDPPDVKVLVALLDGSCKLLPQM